MVKSLQPACRLFVDEPGKLSNYRLNSSPTAGFALANEDLLAQARTMEL